jgi:hypothetical protein
VEEKTMSNQNIKNIKLSSQLIIFLGICLILQFIHTDIIMGDNLKKSSPLENRISSFAQRYGPNRTIVPVFFHTIERYLSHQGGEQSPLDKAFKAKMDIHPEYKPILVKLLNRYKNDVPREKLKSALNQGLVDFPVNKSITPNMLKSYLMPIQSRVISPQFPTVQIKKPIHKYVRGTVFFNRLHCIDMTNPEDNADEVFVVFYVELDGVPYHQKITNMYEGFDRDGVTKFLTGEDMKVFVRGDKYPIYVEKSLKIWAVAYEADCDTSDHDKYKKLLNIVGDTVDACLTATGNPEFIPVAEAGKELFDFVFALFQDDSGADFIGEYSCFWSYDDLRGIAETRTGIKYGTFVFDSGSDKYGKYSLDYTMTFEASRFKAPEKAK